MAGKFRKLTAETDAMAAYIRQEYLEKKRTMNSIGRELGMKRDKLAWYFRRYDIPTRDNTARGKPEVAAAIAERIKAEHWEGKKSLHQIAEEMGLSYSGIQWYTREYGIPVRSRVESMLRASDGHGFLWKGGRWKHESGYIMVKRNGHQMANSAGYVPEHRLVMAEFAGRMLDKDEVVHHVNGVKDDNRVENLQVRSRGGEGQHHGSLTVCPHCGHDLLQYEHG